MAGVLAEWRPVHELIGRMLDNRFQVASFIREGGMAQIFCGVQDEEPRHVAIKIMHPHLANDAEIVGRFLREAKVASRLNHPNIVRILSVGEEMSLLYMVMELIVGDDISAPIKTKGSFSEARAVRIVIDVARALAHAHSNGVVHRDIKPENIMVCRKVDGGEGEIVKVLDFGIAKIFDDKEDAPVTAPSDEARTGARSVLTRVGSMIGTPAYMSPEQGRADPLDHRTDIYSMGVVLYELLTGQLPFDGATPLHVVARHVHDPPPPPSVHCPVHEGIERVIMRALEKDPAARQASAAELAAELEAILPELSTVAEAVASDLWQPTPFVFEGPRPWTAEPLAALAERSSERAVVPPASTVTESLEAEPVSRDAVEADAPTAKRDPVIDRLPPPPVAPAHFSGQRPREGGTRRLRPPSQPNMHALDLASLRGASRTLAMRPDERGGDPSPPRPFVVPQAAPSVSPLPLPVRQAVSPPHPTRVVASSPAAVSMAPMHAPSFDNAVDGSGMPRWKRSAGTIDLLLAVVVLGLAGVAVWLLKMLWRF